jgi:glutamine synthetase
MARINLGKVFFTIKGAFDISADYEKNDVISYAGSSYAARQNVRGIPPLINANSEYWFCMARSVQFEDFTAEERSKLFGEPPATVWENIRNWERFPEKKKVIMEGGIFDEAVINSFAEGALIRWKTELMNRLIPEMRSDVMAAKKLHDAENGTAFDNAAWKKVQAVRDRLAKDSAKATCVFTEIRNAIEAKDYDTVSEKFLEMQQLKDRLYTLYHDYRQNIID